MPHDNEPRIPPVGIIHWRGVPVPGITWSEPKATLFDGVTAVYPVSAIDIANAFQVTSDRYWNSFKIFRNMVNTEGFTDVDLYDSWQRVAPCLQMAEIASLRNLIAQKRPVLHGYIEGVSKVPDTTAPSAHQLTQPLA